MSEENVFIKFKRAFSNGWGNFSKEKKIKFILLMIVSTILLIYFTVMFIESVPRMLNPVEYKVYEYALECVEDELKFPNTATYPSFEETTIVENALGYAWDVSGYGTCENAYGMTLNYSFKVVVVKSKSGEFWCYDCYVD